MKYSIRYSGQFKRSYKLCKKRGYDMSKLEIVLRLLADTGSLPPQYHPLILSGKNWAAIGNVMSNRIGFWYGIKTIRS